MSRRVAGWKQATIMLSALAVLLVAGAIGAKAQEEAPGDDRLIADGRLVYEANCSACHGSDGAGRPGSFPPLLDNPRVEDADYVRTVVRNGLSGEIEVFGETYDGNMPAFNLLSDDQVTAVVAFVQDGLGAPLPEPVPVADAGETAGTSLPGAAVLTYGLGFLIALIGVTIVVTPMALARADGGTFTPVQSWLKAGLIVAYFILATVAIPSMVLESDLLASPPSVYGDLISAELWDIIRSLIGSGVWLAALGLGLWGLRRVQRGKVI